MARMSIDDKFLRDPRVTQLALDLGMSRWEAMGRLLAVFAVCYDLERDVVNPTLIDHAADLPGFSDALFEVDLAVTTKRGLRIRGVKKRIEYLAPKREAGRQGGIKSGESRRNSAKQKRTNHEATVNPPDPVPDPAPDPVPEDQISLSRTILPSTEGSGQPVPQPAETARPRATQQGAAMPGMEATAQGAVPAAGNVAEPQLGPGTIARVERPLPSVVGGCGPFDANDAFARGRLAEATWHRISDAAVSLAAEFKLPEPIPFPAITPSTNRKGFVELKQRIREEGDLAPTVCDRVVENLVKQARAKRSVEWLAEKVFGDNAWLNARNGVDPSARSAPGQRAGPQPAAPRPRDRDPPPKVIPRDELAGPEQFREARDLLARALTSNDDETPNPEPRRRKAAT